LLASRHIKRDKVSLPVDVHRSKTSLLKLSISKGQGGGVRENKVECTVYCAIKSEKTKTSPDTLLNPAFDEL